MFFISKTNSCSMYLPVASKWSENLYIIYLNRFLLSAGGAHSSPMSQRDIRANGCCWVCRQLPTMSSSSLLPWTRFVCTQRLWPGRPPASVWSGVLHLSRGRTELSGKFRMTFSHPQIVATSLRWLLHQVHCRAIEANMVWDVTSEEPSEALGNMTLGNLKLGAESAPDEVSLYYRVWFHILPQTSCGADLCAHRVWTRCLDLETFWAMLGNKRLTTGKNEWKWDDTKLSNACLLNMTVFTLVNKEAHLRQKAALCWYCSNWSCVVRLRSFIYLWEVHWNGHHHWHS